MSSPYRTPAPEPEKTRDPDRRSALREERLIYGFCFAFGVSRVIHALLFEQELGATSAIAVVLGGWGARALFLHALRALRSSERG